MALIRQLTALLKRPATQAEPAPPEDDGFDEAWYLATYPDIAASVANGSLQSGRQHYLEHGRQEGRFPSPLYSEGDRLDPDWYAAAYPAATLDIQAGRAADLAGHYRNIGRFRGYLPNRFAPRPDDAARPASRFGGLWVDHGNAADLIEGRRETGRISDREAALLHAFRSDGYVILESAIAPSLVDAALAELDRAFDGGIPELRFECPQIGAGPIPWDPGTRVHPGKALDLHWWSPTIRDLVFAPAIRNFLELLFERRITATQTLGFFRGSAQGYHQDTTYVPYSLPLQFAASWIALEDVAEGGGELTYLVGSHRLEDHLHAGAYKSVWEAERMIRRADFRRSISTYEGGLPIRAAAAGMKAARFMARKGDVLIWHADLAHGGSPISTQHTRRSVVTHYCPRDVVPLSAERTGMTLHSHEGVAFYASDHYRDTAPRQAT